MNDNGILKENQKRLKKILAPYNPIVGDQSDPNRFLFNIIGLKKAFLPSSMNDIPVIQNLIIKKSLSNFIRSKFFKSNFSSVRQLLNFISQIRLKYDFPFWLYTYFYDAIDFKSNAHLFKILLAQKIKNKPIKLVLLTPQNWDSSIILHLFVLWVNIYSSNHNNAVFISNSASNANKDKKLFSEICNLTNESSINCKPVKSFPMLNFSNNDSKFWFFNANSPDSPRSLNFNYLVCSFMNRWPNHKQSPDWKILEASLPVVSFSNDSVIILHAAGFKRKSHFLKEWLDALNNVSPFSPELIHCFDDPGNILKFDFFEEKLELFNHIYKHHNRRNLPHYPHVSAKLIYNLWQKGLSLEAINWYLAESSFFPSKSSFLNSFPTPISSLPDQCKHTIINPALKR